jgi:O-antigen/teichoic acid export membrane protein
MIRISSNSIIFKGGIATIDQVILSALNFLVQIILIKTLPKDEYGYYAFAFSITLYLISLQNATINTPMTVLLAEKKGSDKNNYLNSLYSGQFIFLLPITIGSLILLLFQFLWGWEGIGISVTIALVVASFGILWREFLRSYFFAEEKPVKVLIIDFLYSLLFVGLIGIVVMFFNLSVPMVIIFMGLAATISSIIIKKDIRFDINWKHIKQSYSENWQFGRWSLLGVTTTHIQSYSYLYLIGILLGSLAMAEVSASRILLVPATLAVTGWGKVVRPHGAKLREAGKLRKFYKELIIASFVFCVIMFIAVIFLNIFSDSLIRFLFTEQYEGIFEYFFF